MSLRAGLAHGNAGLGQGGGQGPQASAGVMGGGGSFTGLTRLCPMLVIRSAALPVTRAGWAADS